MNEPWFRKHDKKWYVTVNGKAVPLSRDKKVAWAKWHEMAAGDLEGLDMPFHKAAAFYLESLESCTEETRKVAKRHLDDFLSHVGKIKCSKLRAHHWTAFVKKKEWAPSTQRTCLNKILACLNYCVDQGKLDPHKFKIQKKELPRFERRKDIVTEDEQRLLEENAPPAFRDFLVGLRLSGARPSELCGARIEHVEGGVLWVKNKTARQTGEAKRAIYISPELRDLIGRLADGREEGLIWRTSTGSPWQRSVYNPAMRRLRLKLGLRKGVATYGYRHRYASRALNDVKANPAHVAKLIGHSDLKMLMANYYHEDPQALLKAVEEITKGQ